MHVLLVMEHRSEVVSVHFHADCDDFGHYYLPMLPPASLLGAHVLLYLHDEARRALRRAPSPAAGLGVVALVVLILGALSEHLPSRPETGWPPIWGMSAGESAAVAATIDRIAARTGPDDRIFVWGWMSSLYTLTDRLPGSRFLYCIFLVGMVPWTNLDDPDTRDQAVPGSWDRFHADIERLRPLYIIDTSPGDYFHYGKYSPSAVPELGRLLDRWYRREEAFRLPDGSDYLHLYRRLDWPGG